MNCLECLLILVSVFTLRLLQSSSVRFLSDECVHAAMDGQDAHEPALARRGQGRGQPGAAHARGDARARPQPLPGRVVAAAGRFDGRSAPRSVIVETDIGVPLLNHTSHLLH